MTLADKLRNKSTELEEKERARAKEIEAENRRWLNEKLKEAPETAKAIVEKWMKEIEEKPYVLKAGEYEAYFSTDSGSEQLHKTINLCVEKFMKKNKLKILESKQSYTPYERGRGEDDWGTHEHFSQTIKFKW